ncbi:GyrI-like domain-containing protein [Nocardioides sp.]|uniref:GyrI-like domain-containing protein n=1 Tax=Nocardioides sp. TaxID=35761 RepID=UPI003D144509
MDETEQTTLPRTEQLQPQITAVRRAHVPTSELASFLGRAYATVASEITSLGREIVGPPFGRYVPTSDGFDVEAGFPVDRPMTPGHQVEQGQLPGGPAVALLHVGPYDEVGTAYATVRQWMSEHQVEATGDPWECYLDDADVPRPRTVLYFPCAPADLDTASAGSL